MAIDAIKARASLVDLLNNARARADAFIDAEAARVKAQEAPEIPVTVIRQMIMARHSCICTAALDLAGSEKVA